MNRLAGNRAGRTAGFRHPWLEPALSAIRGRAGNGPDGLA
jgi:hypothetical protein